MLIQHAELCCSRPSQKSISSTNAAPSGTPQSVMVTNLSSTEIQVSWEAVQAIDQNGIVVVYEIRYEPLETFDGQLMTKYINTSALNIVLSDLQEFVEYNISVRAHTTVGGGPFSLDVSQKTPEDGGFASAITYDCSLALQLYICSDSSTAIPSRHSDQQQHIHFN